MYIYIYVGTFSSTGKPCVCFCVWRSKRAMLLPKSIFAISKSISNYGFISMPLLGRRMCTWFFCCCCYCFRASCVCCDIYCIDERTISKISAAICIDKVCTINQDAKCNFIVVYLYIYMRFSAEKWFKCYDFDIEQFRWTVLGYFEIILILEIYCSLCILIHRQMGGNVYSRTVYFYFWKINSVN